MSQSDRDMLATFIDMADIRPVGEPLRRVELIPQYLEGNRKQRRAVESDQRRKKKKFARH